MKKLNYKHTIYSNGEKQEQIKTGIVEWEEPIDHKMPYRKIKFTNGDLITDRQLI